MLHSQRLILFLDFLKSFKIFLVEWLQDFLYFELHILLRDISLPSWGCSSSMAFSLEIITLLTSILKSSLKSKHKSFNKKILEISSRNREKFSFHYGGKGKCNRKLRFREMKGSSSILFLVFSIHDFTITYITIQTSRKRELNAREIFTHQSLNEDFFEDINPFSIFPWSFASIYLE